MGRPRGSGLGSATAMPAARGLQAAWQSLGPANIGGRVTDIAVHPTRANTVFAGAATGGVWKSTDAGSTFVPAGNPNLTPSIGAPALCRNRRVEAGRRQRHLPGAGVFRSTDSGATWQSLRLTGSDRIGRTAIDPRNANRLFVAAAGNLFVAGRQRGLYRSTDGGTTWQLVLAGANATTGAIDVAISPADPNRTYAAMWDHRRQPNGRVYGGVGSGTTAVPTARRAVHKTATAAVVSPAKALSVPDRAAEPVRRDALRSLAPRPWPRTIGEWVRFENDLTTGTSIGERASHRRQARAVLKR